MSMVPPEVASFVATASRLSGRTLDAIRWATAMAVASGAYDQGAVPELSAAEFSALNAGQYACLTEPFTGHGVPLPPGAP
ncbi:hypothetical protein AB0D54_30270 [Streptomyces xanthophaeus]|uniref:hypothetical protein n=1 Tax=Streptomyces xanthophaeus TaxID=67385 RepID=UPI0034193130